MKVIKRHGTKLVPLFEVTCPECNCLFECDETDFELDIKNFSTIQIVSCPDCAFKINKEENCASFQHLGSVERDWTETRNEQILPQ